MKQIGEYPTFDSLDTHLLIIIHFKSFDLKIPSLLLHQ